MAQHQSEQMHLHVVAWVRGPACSMETNESRSRITTLVCALKSILYAWDGNMAIRFLFQFIHLSLDESFFSSGAVHTSSSFPGRWSSRKPQIWTCLLETCPQTTVAPAHVMHSPSLPALATYDGSLHSMKAWKPRNAVGLPFYIYSAPGSGRSLCGCSRRLLFLWLTPAAPLRSPAPSPPRRNPLCSGLFLPSCQAATMGSFVVAT